MSNFNFEGQNIHYHISGKGKTILFLHGFLESSEMWEEIIPHFKNYQVITVDLPCHGNSRFDGDSCTMEFMAQILHEFFRQIGVKDPIVIGHSMGGYVGLELLNLMPIELILLHSNFWKDSENKKTDRNRVIEVVLKNHKLFVQEAIPALFDINNIPKCERTIKNLIQKAKLMLPNEIVAATKGMRDRVDNSSLLESHKINVIQGENDFIIPSKKMNSELSKLDFKGDLIQINNVGHMSIWENQESLIGGIKTLINN